MKNFPYKITLLDETDSTNTDLKNIAYTADEFTVIAARSQRQGRGRMERKFFSPKNCGFYFSIFLKPSCPPDEAVFITTAAAVAVCDAIKDVCGKVPSVKWVNDVFIDGKKVCGILTESSYNAKENKLDYAIVGIGLNLTIPKGGYPDEIKDIAGAVFDSQPDRDTESALITKILDGFYDYYTGKESHLQKYKKLCFVIGQNVTVFKGTASFPARVLDIDDKCRLIIEKEDNTVEYLDSGEISIKKQSD